MTGALARRDVAITFAAAAVAYVAYLGLATEGTWRIDAPTRFGRVFSAVAALVGVVRLWWEASAAGQGPRRRLLGREAGAATLAGAVPIGAQFAVNYARWRNPFEFADLARMARDLLVGAPPSGPLTGAKTAMRARRTGRMPPARG